MLARIAALLVSVILMPASYAAEATSADWGAKELMQGLAQVKSAKGKFVERKYLSILSKPLEFSGTLLYTAPGRLEKRTLLPKPEYLTLTDDQLTIENPAKNQVRTLRIQDYPVMGAFVESIRSTLAGDLATLNRYYKVSLEGNPREWRLLLKPTQPAMQAAVSEIRISGKNNWVGSIEVIEAEGDRSVMTVTEDAQ